MCKITELSPIDLDLFIAQHVFETAEISDDTGNVIGFTSSPYIEIDDYSPQIYENHAYCLASDLNIHVFLMFEKIESGACEKLYSARKLTDRGQVFSHKDKDVKKAISVVAGQYFRSQDQCLSLQ